MQVGGPSRHPRPQGAGQADPQRSRVGRVETSSLRVVHADLEWIVVQELRSTPPPKSREEAKRGRGRRQDTKAQEPTRRAQAAGGRADDDPGSTPRPTHTHRPAPTKSKFTDDARTRPGQAVEACEVTYWARRGQAARPKPKGTYSAGRHSDRRCCASLVQSERAKLAIGHAV